MKKFTVLTIITAAIVAVLGLGLAFGPATSAALAPQPQSTTSSAEAERSFDKTGETSKEEAIKEFAKPLEGEARTAAVKANGEQLVASLREKDRAFTNVPMTFDGASIFTRFADEADLTKVGADYVYPFPYESLDGGTVKGAVLNNTLRNVSYTIMVYDFVLNRMEVGKGSGIYLRDLVEGNETLRRQFAGMMEYFNALIAGEKDADGCYGVWRAVCTHDDDPSGTLYVRQEFRAHAEELARLLNTMCWVGPVHGQTLGNYRLLHSGDMNLMFPAWFTQAEFQYEGDFVCFAFYWKGFATLEGGMAASYVYFNVNDRRIAIVEEVTPTPTPTTAPAPAPEAPSTPVNPGGKDVPSTPVPNPPTPPTPTPPTPTPPADPVKNPGDDPVNNGNAEQGGGDNQPGDGSGPLEPDPAENRPTAEQHYPESAAVTVDDRGQAVDNVDENRMDDSLSYAEGAVTHDDYVDTSTGTSTQVTVPTTGGTKEQDQALVTWDPSSIGA